MNIKDSAYCLPKSDKGLDIPLFEAESGAAEVPCTHPRAPVVVLTDDEPPPSQSESACDQNCACT
jgi:hypothetical protein